MRRRILPLTVGAVIILGIIVGAVWFQAQKNSGMSSAPPAISSPIAASGPTGTSGPSGVQASPSASPSISAQTHRSNPNPDLAVDANGLSKATVVVTTTQGVIRFKLYSQDAPNTIHRFIELVQKNFYDGLIFHRVVPGFVIQGGDPQGNGTGGSGQKLKAEFNGRRHLEGTVAMARAGDPDSADSQFYITLAPQPHLDKNYTVFGQVVEGMDVVKRIQIGDKMTSVVIE